MNNKLYAGVNNKIYVKVESDITYDRTVLQWTNSPGLQPDAKLK